MNKLSLFTILLFLVSAVALSGCAALEAPAMAAAPDQCNVQA
jgi:hypothetical protein